MGIDIRQAVVGPVQTNCYLVANTKGDLEKKPAFIVDPGDGATKLATFMENEGFEPEAILLTHGHFDHAGAAEALASRYNIPIYAFETEKEVLEDPDKNASWMVGASEVFHATHYLKDEEELDIAGIHIRVLHTPGHTKGGCCFYLPYEDVLFSGDTLFCQSVGRTDLPTGSMSEIVRSIREKLMVLPENTVVFPGHGEATDLEQEREYNPYL